MEGLAGEEVEEEQAQELEAALEPPAAAEPEPQQEAELEAEGELSWLGGWWGGTVGCWMWRRSRVCRCGVLCACIELVMLHWRLTLPLPCAWPTLL